MERIIKNIIMFYWSGFRMMTWGKVLWIIILIKLFIIFFVLKLFFFKPFLADKTHLEKEDYVGTELINLSK